MTEMALIVSETSFLEEREMMDEREIAKMVWGSVGKRYLWQKQI